MREDSKAYFEDPEFKESLSKYEKAVSEGRTVYMDADELTDIAEYYMINNDEKRANKAIRTALQMHPDSVDPQIFLARQQMFHDNLDKAYDICDAISDQNDREVLFLRSELMIREDMQDEAVRFLLRAYETIDDSRALFLYDSACIFFDYELYDEVLVFTGRLEKDFPGFGKTKPLLADTLVAREEYEKAIPLLNDILDRTPYDSESWNSLAVANRGLGNLTEAIDNTEFVLAIEPGNKKGIITKAHCLVGLGRHEEAQALYDKYLQTHPDDAGIQYLNGACLACMGKYAEAKESLDTALAIGSDDMAERMHTYLQLANVESKMHEFRSAIDCLDKARNIMMEEFDGTEFDYHMLVGEVMLENGMKKEAAQMFGISLGESSDKKDTMLNICLSYMDMEYYLDAMLMLKVYLSEFPQEENALSPYMAMCELHLGMTDRYLEDLKKAVEADRETARMLFGRYYPNVEPEEYYLYAFHDIFGKYPAE